MRAALLGLALTGCLVPGEPTLATLDDVPPSYVRTEFDPQPMTDASGNVTAVDPKLSATLVFSEPIDPATILNAVSLVDPSGAAQQVCVFQMPKDQVQAGQEYRILVEAGPFTANPCTVPALKNNTKYMLVVQSSLTDVAGNPLPGNVAVTFTTAP